MNAVPGMTDESSEQQIAARRTNSVLVADDDPLFRRLLESWLRKWGYHVTTAEDGLTAWKVLENDDAPQLLVLDWTMPMINGVELCQRIRSRKQLRYPYILLLTARDDKQDLVTALESGADDYLTKPFNIRELQARLRVGKRILTLQEELIKAREELRFEAMHDRLTTLWNRGSILDFLHRELERAKRTREPLGILMLDIDHFKAVNDTHGHLVGDAVLKEVGSRLSRSARVYDWVGRYGGEEFLSIVSACSIENLRKHAERIRASVAENPIGTAAGNVTVTVSIGASVAVFDPDCDQQTLLQFADSALYRAKKRGRNRVELA